MTPNMVAVVKSVSLMFGLNSVIFLMLWCSPNVETKFCIMLGFLVFSISVATKFCIIIVLWCSPNVEKKFCKISVVPGITGGRVEPW